MKFGLFADITLRMFQTRAVIYSSLWSGFWQTGFTAFRLNFSKHSRLYGQMDDIVAALTLRDLDQLSLKLIRNIGKASSFFAFVFLSCRCLMCCFHLNRSWMVPSIKSRFNLPLTLRTCDNYFFTEVCLGIKTFFHELPNWSGI